jgi:hypothetical protein
VGFEPTRTLARPSGFQDRRHRPLGEPSADNPSAAPECRLSPNAGSQPNQQLHPPGQVAGRKRTSNGAQAPEQSRDEDLAVSDACRTRWSYLESSSDQRLPPLVAQIGHVEVFIHDSLHTARNTMFEMG